MYIERMKGQDYIDHTRKYLDYLEEHLNNIAKAFQEVSDACDGMVWVGDDYTWHNFRHEVMYHDVSKFSKEEFTQYRRRFFEDADEIKEGEVTAMLFDQAWEHHKEKNPHHHESIRYAGNHGTIETDIIHMIIDWTAMGYKFGNTAEQYYKSNKDTIHVDPEYIPFLHEIFKRLKKYKKRTQSSRNSFLTNFLKGSTR